MSAKEMIVEYLQSISDQMPYEEILRHLQSLSHRAENEEKVEDWSDGELTDDEWRAAVAHSLRDELADPREDIYTLEDGVPPDEAP